MKRILALLFSFAVVLGAGLGMEAAADHDPHHVEDTCSDGIDNDGDGGFDTDGNQHHPPDDECNDPNDGVEDGESPNGGEEDCVVLGAIDPAFEPLDEMVICPVLDLLGG